MEPHRTALPEWAYPVEDDVPETILHLRIRTRLYQLVQRTLSRRGVEALTGSDQFLYWVQGQPHRVIAPDLYVVLDVPADYDVRSWQVWREGKAPELAVEIVSDDVQKDYELAPVRYADVGVRELVIVDPLEGPGRIRWQVYRRDSGGDLVRTQSTQADRVECQVLGCHLRYVVEAGQPWVRIGEGPDGDTLVPTADESEAAERAQRRALEAEVAALRARLAEADDS